MPSSSSCTATLPPSPVSALDRNPCSLTHNNILTVFKKMQAAALVGNVNGFKKARRLAA